MTDADINVCGDCGWTEAAENSPNRRKCPDCGAPFSGRYIARKFERTRHQ